MKASENDCVQLCSVGDVLYRVGKNKKLNKYVITKITITEATNYKTHWAYTDDHKHSYFNRNIISSCFKTMKDAKQEIQRRKNIERKREILRVYERKLNKKLGIGEHYIVK